MKLEVRSKRPSTEFPVLGAHCSAQQVYLENCKKFVEYLKQYQFNVLNHILVLRKNICENKETIKIYSHHYEMVTLLLTNAYREYTFLLKQHTMYVSYNICMSE